MRSIIVFSAFFVIAALLPSSGYCQTNDEGLAFLQLNFFNPGARALGMGGAFVGLADDATAALTNPAGLTALNKPEMSLEFSATRYRNQIPWNTGFGTFEGVDLVDGGFVGFNYFFHFEPEDFPGTPKSLSFGSFVYPVVRNKFVFSGFYNEQTRFERNFHTQGFFMCENRNGEFCNEDFPPTVNSLHLSIKNIGVSSGVKPTEMLSFGVTFNFSTLNLSSRTDRLCGTHCEPRSDVMQSFTENAKDNRIGYTVGALIKPLKGFSAGVVFSKRPIFHITAGSFNLCCGTGEHSEILRIPDSLAAGFSLRPVDRFAINMDIVRIRYSQLMDSYYNAYYGPNESEPFTRYYAKSSFEVTDGTEYRIGGEYVIFAKKIPFAIRGGYWREPFHGMTFRYEDADIRTGSTGSGQDIGNTVPYVFPFFSRSFRQNYDHVTLGAGVVLKMFTIDWAYDHSKNFKRFVASTVVYLDWLDRK